MSAQLELSADAPLRASYYSLPAELRHEIIEEACTAYSSVLSRNDVLSLMLVSRTVYAIVAALWYKEVEIKSPSTLAAFVRAVVAKLALGRLVKSLFLGPPWHLPHDWWPMRHLHGPSTSQSPAIAPSLRQNRLLPRGCGPERRWPLPDGNVADWSARSQAIGAALLAAQAATGINLRRPQYSLDGQVIGSTLWLIGVMEMQAALDLYLMEVRRVEDQPDRHRAGKDGSRKTGLSYPILVLTTSTPSNTSATLPSRPSFDDKPLFVLHRTHLLQHLYRRGGPADHFDSPLLFARSGIELLAFDAQGRGLVCEDLWQRAEALYAEAASSNTSSDLFASLALPETCTSAPIAHDLACSLDAANYSASSTGGNLALARVLLTLTPSVEHLFITGFLQRLLCGEGAALPPPSLRSLSLGPLTSFRDESLCPAFQDGRLDRLTSLCLRGPFLADRKRACFTALPRLKRGDWALCWHDREAADIVEIIKPLLSAAPPPEAAEAAETPARKRSRTEDDEDDLQDDRSSSPPYDPHWPRLEIWVDVASATALREELSPAALAAWNSRRPVSHQPLELSIHKQEWLEPEKERLDLASEEVEWAYEVVREERPGWA